MVALLVVGIALPALMVQITAQVDGSAYLRDKAYARWVAEEQLSQMQLEQRLSGGSAPQTESGSREMLGQTWYWSANTLPTGFSGMSIMRVSVGLSPQQEMAFVEAFTMLRLPALPIADRG